MPAYLIAEIDITDPATFEEYRTLVPATLEKYGGRYLARGGRAEGLEGDRGPARVVILQFPSYEQAKAWHDSEEYRAPKAIRQRSARTNLILVEGLADGQ